MWQKKRHAQAAANAASTPALRIAVQAQAAAAEQPKAGRASLAADDAAEIHMVNELRKLGAKKSRTATRLKDSDAILKVAALQQQEEEGGEGEEEED